MTTRHEQSISVANIKDFTEGTPHERAAFVDTVGSGLRDIGFFAVESHGVDLDLVQQAYRVAEEFFLLPEEQKLAYTTDRLQGGYARFGSETALGHSVPDLKEFWHVRRVAGSSRLSDVWPREVPEFRVAFERLFKQLDELSQILLRACALYLGEDEALFADMCERSPSVQRVIHYPPVADSREAASVRAAAHEDINLITLLCEATDSGLELLERDGSWRPVHAQQGQIVVDSGDMIQNLTNGYYKATTHRVVNPSNSRSRRFSMPFFAHPRLDVDLTPLASCLERTGGAPRFPSWTAGEFLVQRLQEISSD